MIRLAFTAGRSETCPDLTGVGLSDLAVELLDRGMRGERVARPRWTSRDSLGEQIGVLGERQPVDPYFTSDLFIQTYLNPVTKVGCARHIKPECLCDVDVTLTADIEWVNCPPQLWGVETEEELVEAAANIWLNLDLLTSPDESCGTTLLGDESTPEVIEAVKAGKTHEECKLILPTLGPKAYILLRRVYGVSRTRKTLPVERVMELASQGISGVTAQRILNEETGVLYSLTALRKVRVRNGIGSTGAKRGARPSYPHARIHELGNAGLTTTQIMEVLANEGVTIPRRRLNIILRPIRVRMGSDEGA